jgi:hypothetical protein
MRELLEEMKDMNILDSELLVNSAIKEDDADSMDTIVDSIIESMK